MGFAIAVPEAPDLTTRGLELVIRLQTLADVWQSPLGRTGRADVLMARQTDARGE